MSSIIEKLSGWKSSAAKYLQNIPSSLRGLYDNFILHLRQIKHNFHNMKDVNISLAKYHLSLGNLTDVILRCRIALFFHPEAYEAYNILAIAYYLKGNIKKSKLNLDLAKDHKDVVLMKFLSDSNVTEIPIEVFSKFRDYTIDSYIEDKDDLYTTLSNNIVKMVCKNFDEIDDKFKILDINPAVGFVGSALTKKLPDGILVKGVECSAIMSEFLVRTHDSYSDIIDYNKFFQQTSDSKYNLIFSVLGLEYLQQISKILVPISKMMQKKAYIGLVFRISSNRQTYLNNTKAHFIYDREFLEKELDVADFEIADITESRLYNNSYIYIVCTKK